uniref:EF-hand domain-containing protein n=1 Tax=Dunaliella tertiolecta TaxID=3047 RepID=A0A7S3QPW0_DUNTE
MHDHFLRSRCASDAEWKASGVLPFAFNHNQECYVLLGSEITRTGPKGKMEAIMWSDFGGKREAADADSIETASREFAEETLGVFGGVSVDPAAVKRSADEMAARLRSGDRSLCSVHQLRKGAYHMYACMVTYIDPIFFELAMQQNDGPQLPDLPFVDCSPSTRAEGFQQHAVESPALGQDQEQQEILTSSLSQQQQQQQQQWAPPYGPYAQQQLVGNAQHTPWPQSSSLVTSGGGPYAQAAGFPTRQGPFGLMQELERFLISRRAQMLDFFAMAASSVHGLPPSTSGRPSTVGSGARGIAVTRPALVGVVQRAVPSASVHDTRYVQAIIDALLPHQRMISMEDWEGCVFQGAAAEAAVLQRTLPLSLLAPLRSLADAWQSAPGARAHAVKRFQELDFDRSGYLSTSDQQLLLSSLLGLPPPVGMPAAYSNPAAFPSAKGHSAAGDMGIAMSSAEAGLWLCVALHSQLPTGSRPGFMTFNELEQAVQFMAYQFSPSPLYSTQQQQQQQQQLMASAPNPYSGRDMSPQRSLESGPGYSGPYAQYGRDISPQRSLESVPPYAQYGRDLTPQRSMQSVPAYDAPNAQYARDPSPPRSMQSGPAYDVPHAQYGRDLSPRRSMQGVPGYTGPQAPYGRDSSRPRSWAGEDPYGWPSRRFAGQGGGPDSWGSAYEDAGGPASTSPHTSHGSMSDAAMYGGAVPAGAYPRSSSPPPPHFDSTPAAGGVRFRDDAMGSVDAQRFDEAVFSQAGRYTGNPGAAYHAWTYENRQKVLDTYFNRDHQRKMRTLRSQKDKADAAAALEEAIEAKEDAAAETRERLWRLAKRAEKDAYEHTGYKPLKMLEVDEVAERINAALDAAVSITRKKSLLEGTGYEGSRSMDMYRPPPDLRSLLDQICSPGWYERMALPANLETLKVALAVRKDALELARLQDASVQAAHFAVQGVEMAGQEAKHAMGVQAALLQDALMARTAELERCLLADAYAVASQASATAQHAAFAAQHQDNRLSGMPVPRQHSLKPPQQQQQQQQPPQRQQQQSAAAQPTPDMKGGCCIVQ